MRTQTLVRFVALLFVAVAACDSGTPLTAGDLGTDAAALTDARLTDATTDIRSNRGDSQLVADGRLDDGATVDADPADAGDDGVAPVDGSAIVDAATVTDAALADASSAADGPLGPTDAGLDVHLADAAPPLSYKIVYGSGGTKGLAQLASIDDDGSNYQAVPLLGDLLLEPLAALPGHPGEMSHAVGAVTILRAGSRYVRLPQQLGYVLRLKASASTQPTLYSIWSDGAINALAAGTLAADFDKITLYPDINAFSSMWMATVKGGNTPLLVRTNGMTWSGSSSPVKDISIPGWSVSAVCPESFVFNFASLYFVGQEKTSATMKLYRYDITGGAAASGLVALPDLNGKPTTIASCQGFADRYHETLAFLTQNNAGETAILALPLRSAPKHFAVLPQLRSPISLSPSGLRAFVTTGTTGNIKGHIAELSGTTTALSTAANFTSAVTQMHALYWVDDDNLLLTAGADQALDVFRYQVSTAQLSNLTRSGTASAAPWGPGKLEVDLSWLSLTWRQVNIVAGEPTAKQIYTVDTKTYAVVNVMPNHQINAATLREDLRGAPRSPLVFLIARPMNSGPLFEENVFVYNSDTASPIKQLSHWLHGSASVELNNLMPAANARHVAYTKGDGANEVLYVAPADASQKPWALNGNGSYLSPAFAWSPDGAYLVFGSGNSASSRDLWRAPATGGTLTKLRSTQAQTIHIFQVR